MQNRSPRQAFALVVVACLLATVAGPASAAVRRSPAARPAGYLQVSSELLSLLWDAFRVPLSFWGSAGVPMGGAVGRSGWAKEGGSWDPNGAPSTTSTPEGPMVDEGGMIDPNGRQ